MKNVFFLNVLLASTLILVTACGHNPVSPLGFTPTPTMNTATPTNTPTNTQTAGPTGTFTNTPTSTATNTATNTPTNTIPGPTSTFTNTPTSTATNTVTNTPTDTITGPTFTFTNTPTTTDTNTVTNTPTDTVVVPTSTFTDTATNTNTNTPTNTPTDTVLVPTATFTDTATDTATNTPTNTPTDTATNTATSTFGTPDAVSQATQVPTMTHTLPTITDTPVLTDTPSAFTPTSTPSSTPYSTSSWSLFAELPGSSGGSATGIAIGAGFIAVSDYANNDVQVFSNNGTLLYTFALNSGGQLTGGIAFDQFGELYVCDITNAQVEGFILSPSAATYDYTWSGQGALTNPIDVKIDPQGNLVVADLANGVIYNFAWTDDTLLNETTPNSYEFAGVALDPSGNIYATDVASSQVVEFDNAYNNLNTSFNGSSGSWTTNLTSPGGITVDSQNNLWIADSGNARVVQATTQGAYVGEIDGFSFPAYLTFDSVGSLFVTDENTNIIYQYLFN
jgi:hypothetical protein